MKEFIEDFEIEKEKLGQNIILKRKAAK